MTGRLAMPNPGKRFTDMTREELQASRAYHQSVLDHPSPGAHECGRTLFRNAIRTIDKLLGAE